MLFACLRMWNPSNHMQQHLQQLQMVSAPRCWLDKP